jgi:hypothetical protein
MVELAPRIRIRGIWSITVFARSRNGGGKADEANFISFTCGSHGEGTLPAAGDYTVRAYLMRRDEVGRYRLEIVIDSSKSIRFVNRSTAAGQASKGMPDDGFQVSAWTGACQAAGSNAVCTLTDVRAAQSSTVSFRRSVGGGSLEPIPAISSAGLLALLAGLLGVGGFYARRRR